MNRFFQLFSSFMPTVLLAEGPSLRSTISKSSSNGFTARAYYYNEAVILLPDKPFGGRFPGNFSFVPKHVALLGCIPSSPIPDPPLPNLVGYAPATVLLMNCAFPLVALWIGA